MTSGAEAGTPRQDSPFEGSKMLCAKSLQGADLNVWKLTTGNAGALGAVILMRLRRGRTRAEQTKWSHTSPAHNVALGSVQLAVSGALEPIGPDSWPFYVEKFVGMLSLQPRRLRQIRAEP